MKLRPSTFADYPALAEVLRAAGSRHAAPAATLEHQVRGVLEHPLRPHFYEVVADQGGQIVGRLSIWQDPGRLTPGQLIGDIAVHPDWQGRGLGRKLAQEAEAHLRGLGVRKVVAGTYEHDTRSMDFLRRQGFTKQFRYFDNVLDLRGWDAEKWPVHPLPAGVRVLTLAELIAEAGEEEAWQAFYAAFAEAREDVPSEMPPSPTLYEVFRKRAQTPGYSPETVFLAVADTGEVTALSELKTDPQDPLLMHIGLTGTRRAYRRQGLGLAVKLAGIHAALARGVERIKTGNATSNAPILALNEALGFRPERVWVEMGRSVTQHS